MEALFSNQPDQSEDFYAILGCDELSTVVFSAFVSQRSTNISSSLQKEQIQTEYRIRALQFHPDKNLDDPTASKIDER